MPEVHPLAQAMWEGLGILGFDLDGDKSPHMSEEQLITWYLQCVREHRKDYDDALDEIPLMSPYAARLEERKARVAADAEQRDKNADGRDWEASKRDMAANADTWMHDDDRRGKAAAGRESAREDRLESKSDRAAAADDRALFEDDQTGCISHTCPVYTCPSTGDRECLMHGGFDRCCDHSGCPGFIFMRRPR